MLTLGLGLLSVLSVLTECSSVNPPSSYTLSRANLHLTVLITIVKLTTHRNEPPHLKPDHKLDLKNDLKRDLKPQLGLWHWAEKAAAVCVALKEPPTGTQWSWAGSTLTSPALMCAQQQQPLITPPRLLQLTQLVPARGICSSAVMQFNFSPESQACFLSCF